MPSILVAGLGEVGSALYRITAASRKFDVYGIDKDPSKTTHTPARVPKPVDYLHIAIPYTEGFEDTVAGYAEVFKPRLIIIHSTVRPGTSRKIRRLTGIPVAYSPVRGKHPNLARHMLFWSKWVAATPPAALDEAARHLHEAGFRVEKCGCIVEDLELAKLWETVYRAVMIAAWQELHRYALEVGASVGTVAEFVAEVHRVLGDRPVYYPGVIGGHCLMENLRIMLSIRDSDLLRAVARSNERRRAEIHDSKIQADIEKVKSVWRRLVPLDYYGGEG